jgi:hypothetical protein
MAEKAPAKPATAPKDNKTPRERFKTVGANRVGKTLKALRNLRNVSSRKSYEYTEADVSKMLGAIDNELAALKTVFADALAGKSTSSAKDSFTF